MDASAYQASLINWQLFCTLTFRSLDTPRLREVAVWEFMRHIAECYCHMPLVKLPVFGRWETGEIGERPHCHALVAGLPAEEVNLSTCFRLNSQWQHRAGFAQVRLFGDEQSRLRVASYICKGHRSNGADCYELRKFGRAERTFVTDAAWREMLAAVGEPYRRQS